MRTEIDVTLSDDDADVADTAGWPGCRDASERANALVDSLLLLARTEAQAGRRLVRKVPATCPPGDRRAVAIRREVERLSLDVRRRWTRPPSSATPGCSTGSPAT